MSFWVPAGFASNYYFGPYVHDPDGKICFKDIWSAVSDIPLLKKNEEKSFSTIKAKLHTHYDQLQERTHNPDLAMRT